MALLCAFVEAFGLGLMRLASDVIAAAIGAVLIGLGAGLSGIGVGVVRRATPECRGVAMSGDTADVDLPFGVSRHVFGLVASAAGVGTVFLVSGLVALGGAGIALWLPLQDSP